MAVGGTNMAKLLKDENGEGLVEISFDEIKAETDKAKLFIIEEEEYWIPVSQIEDIDDENNIVYLTQWIAEQKELI